MSQTTSLYLPPVTRLFPHFLYLCPMMLHTILVRRVRKATRAGKLIIRVAGIIFLTAIALAFTDLPFWGCYHLAVSGTALEGEPDYIVVLGAGGMPGAEGFMRCHTASLAAKAHPKAFVVIALPTLPQYFSNSHTYRMYREMVFRGVDSTRFLFEIAGTNTHEQALGVAQLSNRPDTCSVLIISSPEHLFRAVRTFRKAGFGKTGGRPAFESGIEANLLITESERQQGLVSPNRLPSLRYNLWNYLKLEIDFVRELAAIGWYKANGWM